MNPRLRSFSVSFVFLLVLTGPCPGWGSVSPGEPESSRLWLDLPENQWAGLPTEDPMTLPSAARLLYLLEPEFENLLTQSPMEFTREAQVRQLLISLPLPDGSWSSFRIVKSPILSDNLAMRFPHVHTYRLQGIDDVSATGRVGFTGQGMHAIVFMADGTVYLSPVRGARGYYRSYWKSDVPRQPLQCLVEDYQSLDSPPSISPEAASSNLLSNPSGDELHTYRLAISATGEYTTFFGGVSEAADAIVTTFNRVVGIYEREVAISFELVAMNIYDDPETDPFTDGTSVNGTLLGENQTALDAVVGSANYDIGHVFTQASGGLVQGRACNDANKARGGTGLSNPSGDVFDVDYVSHEIGHQLDASHTWNGNSGSCSAGQWVASSAYEPGSGSTIMAYAGICSGQNVQLNSDDYFHTRSFDQMTAFRANGGSCGVVTATGNTAPTVDAGPNYTIPTSTPFTLTATGSDPDGDPITFNWEQFDLGNRDGLPQSTFTTGPLFRSRPATMSPSRTIPRLQDLIDGAALTWEVLPSVERDLTFRVTARDNLGGGGGVDHDTMSITVQGDPFFIQSPQAGSALECGDEDVFLWQVGGGSVASDVEALLSTDGGASFSTVIASTPNVGSANVSVPTTLTGSGWLKLEAVDNIFFALSGPFSIVDTLPPLIAAPGDLIAECSGHDGTAVSLGDPAVSDLCDSSPSVDNDAPLLFPVGTTTVTWQATDASGNSSSDTQLVTIEDTIPPEVSIPLDVWPVELWPVNHKLVEIDIGLVGFEDICDPDPVVFCSVESSQPPNATGDGNTAYDIVFNGEPVLTQGTGPIQIETVAGEGSFNLQLRAERSGRHGARDYIIECFAIDNDDNQSAVTVATVTVPFSRRESSLGF